MKKQFPGLFLIMALTMIFFSCCSNNDDVTVKTLGATTYTDANGLKLTYSGLSMLGKQVAFTPDAQDPSKATLTLSGVEMIQKSKSTMNSATGVIPGISNLTIPVSNINNENETITFEGTHEVNNITIAYKGTADAGAMNLDVTAVMPTNDLAGKTFKLLQPQPWQSTPFYINWQADDFPLGEDGSWNIQGALSMILMMTKIGEQTIPQMLTGVFSEVTFLEDGNIQAKYKDALTDTEWKTSPLNLAMYTVENGKIRLFLNFAHIAQITNTDLAPMLSMVEGFIGGIDFTSGIPIAYSADTEDPSKMNIYLDEEFLLPILQALKPILSDQQIVESLIEAIKAQAGEMGPMVDAFLKPVLLAFSSIVDTSTTIQLGITVAPAE